VADDASAEAGGRTASSTQARPLLFISHRHADSGIANVIREFARSRSSGRVDVFQSSSASAEAPRIGGVLNEELVTALWRANLVILVYTTEDQDWAYCMWECGVAIQPETPFTRIVVFQCGNRVPAVFADRVRVNVRNAVDVQRFADEFLTSPEFFPRYGHAISDFTPNDPSVQDAAQQFFEDLQSVVPKPDDEGMDVWFPYPYLRLELTFDQVAQIGQNRTLDAARDLILDAQLLDGDREAARIFGMPSLPPRATLRTLVDNWKSRFPDDEAKWVDGVASQLMETSGRLFPTLRWELMRSMDRNDGTWYAPVVNRVRTLGAAQATQFDVYFDKFEVDADGSVLVGVPASAPQGDGAPQ